MSGSSGRPRPASTSPHRITPGNAAPTKTPMASCANISPSARAWPTSPNTIAIGSRRNSTADRGSGSVIEPRRNAMRGETRCCTSKLISNRSAIKVVHQRRHGDEGGTGECANQKGEPDHEPVYGAIACAVGVIDILKLVLEAE